MKALILAAGYGRRMQPLTANQHKTLLRVGQRTIIEWILDALQQRNISDITIVTGYRAEELTAFVCQAYLALHLNFIHNERYAQTNNIHSLALALDHMVIDEDLLLIECDIIFEPAVLDRLLAASRPNVALVDRYRRGMDGTVAQIKGGVITAVIPPHAQDAAFDFSDKYKTLNIYRFSPQFCAGPFKKLLSYYASVIDDNQYYELVLGILVYLQRETIHAEVLDGERWAEIDDPNDLEVARFIFDKEARQEILDAAHGGYWNHDILDFRYLRNMYFPSADVLAELRDALPAMLQNYGSGQAILNRKLAYYLCCDERRVLALNGASQIYPLLQQYCAGKSVAIPAPTFGEYRRVFPVATYYQDNGVVDRGIIEQLAAEHAVMVLVNPNNPTGTLLPTQWIYDLAARHAATLFLLDESFIEFSGEPSILPLLEQQPLANVILLKSLSKTLGVPGLRLGFVYTTAQDFLAFARAMTPIWNLNSLAEHFLEVILKHRPAIAESFRQSIADREQFADLLAPLPVVRHIQRGAGNFLLLELACDRTAAQALTRAFLRRNVYVADVSQRFPGVAAYLRVAVRLPEENAVFANLLQNLAQELVYGAR